MTVHTEQRWLYHPDVVRLFLPWLIVLLFAAIGYRSLLPPDPISAAAPDDQFSAERAIEHVLVIAKEPHPMGTQANAVVRAYIVEQLEASGIAVELQTTTVRDFFGSELVPVVNVIGRIPGSANTGAVALMGHYDTVPTTSGANDNSAAVAAILETGRALLAGPPLQNDVLLLFTDGEEPAPRIGATAFVDHHPAFDDIGLAVNFEATGGSGASTLVETSGSEDWLISGLAARDNHPAAFSFITEVARLLGDIGTDFDGFRNAGVLGLHFAYLHGSPIYHTAADNIDAVSLGSLQHHGAHALSITRHFGDMDLDAPVPENTVVFFTIRPFLVRYPTGWAIPLALLAIGVASVGIAHRRRPQRDATWSALLRNTLMAVGVGLIGTVLGTVIWLAIVAVRSTPGVVESYLYLSCLVTLIALVIVKTMAKIGQRSAFQTTTVLLWLAMAGTTAFTVPGFSYLFVWPALAAAMVLWRRPGRGALRQMLGFMIVAAPTLVLGVPAIDVFFQLGQPRPGNPDSSVPAVVAVAILLALMAAGLVRTAWPEPDADNPNSTV